MKNTLLLLLFMTCAVLPAQEFNLPTPKGNLVVNVASNSFYLNSFFKMAGRITNNTDVNLSYVKLRVVFLDAGGSEIAALCPRTPKYAYCVSLGANVAAHQTVPIVEEPGIVINTLNTGKLPKIAGYQLSFEDGLYDVGYQFTMLKPSANDELTYEDAGMGFKFVAGPKGIRCAVRNLTTEPVSINWNVVSFIDATGEAHKIVRSGVRYMEKDATQPPTLIPPSARITETIFPADRIASTSSGWRESPLWPEVGKIPGDPSDLKGLEGSTFSVFMPIEIGGKTKNYSFVFKISRVVF